METEKKKTGNIKKLAVGRKDLFILAPEDIHENEGWNVRQDTEDLQAHIRQLANSIIEVGVLQPLTVFMDGPRAVITDGHCRLLAVKLAIAEGADIKGVPVRTEERFSNEADRVLSMLTRNSGRPLAIPEQAEVVKRLLSFNWTEAEISRKTGSSRQHVNTLVCFLASPEAIKEMVKNGQVSATTAVNVVREEGEGAVGTLKGAVDKANQEGRSKATPKDIKPKKKKPKDIIKPIEDFAGKLPIYEDGDKIEEILKICKRLRELID